MHDDEVTKASAGAEYAGDEDPYVRPREDEDDDEE
jgi:ribosome-binding factor A